VDLAHTKNERAVFSEHVRHKGKAQMNRSSFLVAALLVATPAAAQVATVPAPAIPLKSLAQGWGTDITTSISVTLFGYTPSQQIPHLLTNQTAKIAPLSLLQTQFSVEFPANTTNMTVTQMVVKSTASASTFQSTMETITPPKPLAIQVPAGQKVWVVYKAPQGQQATLNFHVGTAPAQSACPTTSLKDAQGVVWTLEAATVMPDKYGCYILRNGTRFNTYRAVELRLVSGVIYLHNGINEWYRVTGPSSIVRTTAPA
jgi:hypothetical protein